MLSLPLSNGHVVRVHCIPGAGLPLVFIHGLGCASSCDYPPVVSSPALLGRRAVLVDLLGYGFSDKPDSYDYSVAAQAESVVEVLRLLELTSVHLYGHSMGGSIAIVAASLAKDRVSNLILSEPNLDPGGGTFSRVISAQDEGDYVRTGHHLNVSQAVASGDLTWAGSMRVASPLAVHRSASSLVQGSHPTWRTLLCGLTVPRTVLFGERSLPDDDSVALPESGVRVGIVPNAGHSMAWENPAGLAQAIASAADAASGA